MDVICIELLVVIVVCIYGDLLFVNFVFIVVLSGDFFIKIVFKGCDL